MSVLATPVMGTALAFGMNQLLVTMAFVNPVLKRAVCERAVGGFDRRWLQKLRPWYGHDDHFHVRLACPVDSPDCQPQDPLPPGDGCTAVEWWFSPDAQATQTKRQAEAPTPPALPPACQALLTN